MGHCADVLFTSREAYSCSYSIALNGHIYIHSLVRYPYKCTVCIHSYKWDNNYAYFESTSLLATHAQLIAIHDLCCFLYIKT